MKKKIIIVLSYLLIICLHSFSQEWNPLFSEIAEEPQIRVISSGLESTNVEISLAGFLSDQVNTPEFIANRLLLSGGVNETEAGFPDMQHLTISLQIPDRGNTRIRIINAEFSEFKNFKVAPLKGDPQFSDLPDWDTYSYNLQIYKNKSFYPENLIEAGRPYIWCDARGQAIQVYPFQYNPATETLRVYHSISFEIISVNEPAENELINYSASYGKLSGLNTVNKNHFANYGNSLRYTPVEEAGNMLIICPAQFIDVLKPFADWKTQTGIECEIVDMASIANAEVLKQFVSDYYYSKGLTYLLLAGDAAQVPTLQAENGASDNMYGYIAGNDHYPEVLVGRFPAETVRQLTTMVERSMNYEKTAPGNAAYANFTGIASELGPGDDGEKDFEHLRNLGKILLEGSYNQFTELYDGSQGGTDAQGNPSRVMVEEAVNIGTGAIMYIGHGTINSWQTTGFSSTDVTRLSNTVVHPFIWSAGCNSGDFVTTTCLAEAWLRAENNDQPTGAVAAMMSTSTQSWYPPMEAQDEIALILAGRKISVNTRTFGGISMSACMKMNDKYGLGGYRVTDTWNIFGDPSVVVRTAEPKEISVHHASVIGRDARGFVVKLPVSDALACISHNGKLLGAARAEEGVAVINLQQLPVAETINLTITDYNYKPYITEITITDLPAIAVNPTPVNKSRKVSAYTGLHWETTDGMEPEYYEVFIDDGLNPDWDKSCLIAFNKEVSFPEPLAYNTTYSWKVVSHNSSGTVESAIFTFTTIDSPDEDFENQGFPRSNWMNNSTQIWSIDGNTSFEGRYSLRSGNIENNQSSRLAYNCFTNSCDYLGFRKKVSSQENSDKLQLYIDGVMLAEWSGENGWSEEIFPVEPGNHLIEWIYTKDSDGLDGSDAAWLDNIYLPENQAATFNANDFSTCPDKSINLNALASDYALIEWETSGNGIFSDASEPDATYYPTAEELESGKLNLSLKVYSNYYCAPFIKPVTISFYEKPEMPVVNDTVLYSGETLKINVNSNNTASYKVLPVGITDNSFLIEADNLQSGANQLSLSSESEFGCVNELFFTVTKIEGSRPQQNAGRLAVYPNPARESISFNLEEAGVEKYKVQVFDVAGQLVLQGESALSYNNSLDLNGLSLGIYMLRVEYGNKVRNGKFIKII